MKVQMRGMMRGGHLIVPDRDALKAHLSKLPDGPIELWVFKPHSSAIQGYYFGPVLREISKEIGCDTPETHELMKAKFNEGKTTTGLDDGEMADYVDRIIRWAAEWLHVVVPDPPPNETTPTHQPRAR